MMIILILLLVSAIISFMIAPKHNIVMVVVSSLILALTVAMVAWRGDFGLLPGIAITFACVTVSQFAYLLRLWLSTGQEDVLTDEPSHNQIRQDHQNKIPDKQTHKNSPSHLTR